MASYAQLYQVAQENASLRARMTTACAIAADAVLQETQGANLAARRAWAAAARDNPEAAARELVWPCLAQLQVSTPSITPAQIDAAADSAILSAVNTAISRRYGAAG